MTTRQEIRIAGSGGQGVILAAVILAEAGLIAGQNVAQTQSIGPEARGGMCRAEVVITDGKIGYYKVRKPTFTLVLTQLSMDQYTKALPETSIVMADDTLTVPEGLPAGVKVIRLPILHTASEVIGKAFTANIVALGAINKVLSLVSDDVLREAVGRNLPAGTEELNFKALEMGAQLV